MKLKYNNNNIYIVEYNKYIVSNQPYKDVCHELGEELSTELSLQIGLKEFVQESTGFMQGLVAATQLTGQDKWDAYMMLLTDGAMEGESVMNQGFAHKKLKALLDDEAAWKRELGQGVVNVWMMTHDGF